VLISIGVPWFLPIVALGILGGLLSYRLMAARVFIVFGFPFAYFVAYVMMPAAALPGLNDNPSLLLFLRNSALIYLPFAIPALGSMIALLIEKRLDKRKTEQEVITEESLLAEKIPSVHASEIDYDLTSNRPSG